MAAWDGWEAQVLAGLNAPRTRQTIQFLDSWQAREGGAAAFNPLNTTLSAGAVGSYNSVGVRIYPSAKVGAAATVQTLQAYPNIVNALRSGDPTAYQADPQVQAEFLKWSGNGYRWPSSSTGGLGSTATASRGTRPGGGIVAGIETGLGTGLDVASGGVSGLLGVPSAIPNPLKVFGSLFGDVSGGLGDIAGALKAIVWLLNPVNILRVFEGIIGFTLVLTGLYYFGKTTADEDEAEISASDLGPKGIARTITRGATKGKLGGHAPKRAKPKTGKRNRITGSSSTTSSNRKAVADEARRQRQRRRERAFAARNPGSGDIPF